MDLNNTTSTFSPPQIRRSVAWGLPILLMLCGTAQAQQDPPDPPQPQTPKQAAAQYKVRAFQFEGLTGNGLTQEQILALSLPLAPSPTGYRRPQLHETTELIALGQLDQEGATFSGSGLKAILERISRAYTQAGFAAVRPVIDRKALDRLTAPGGDGVLVIRIVEGVVGQVNTRTIREGEDRAKPSAATKRIGRKSPVAQGDVLRIGEIDQYIRRLNRHPGRRVDAVLSPGAENSLELEYIVSESKPWLVYGQVSNTGTPETDELRERFGLSHHNLTGADDILSLDYITGNFDEVHAVVGSYERPFPGLEDLFKIKLSGSYTQYEASQVGLAGDTFEGETTGAGVELIWNFFDKNDTFLDAFAGIDYHDISVDNNVINISGDTEFLVLSAGVRADKQTSSSNTTASISIQTNLDSVIETDQAQVERLGRLGASDDWVMLAADLEHSFYLDSLIGTDAAGSNAHELVFTARGQTSLDRRVAPNFVLTAGGMYSVRGYPEAFSAGDQGIVGSVEYRYHWPRTRTSGETGSFMGKSFNWRPSTDGSAPDWDLVLKGFVDAGYTRHADKLLFERNVTTVGAGIGADLVLGRNLTARVDWGWALNEADDGSEIVSAGSNRVHFALTLLY